LGPAPDRLEALEKRRCRPCRRAHRGCPGSGVINVLRNTVQSSKGIFYIQEIHFKSFSVVLCNVHAYKGSCQNNVLRSLHMYKPATNAKIVTYNATSSPVRFENKYFLLSTLKKPSSLLQSCCCCCKFGSRSIRTWIRISPPRSMTVSMKQAQLVKTATKK
jgi:hypothetical protein